MHVKPVISGHVFTGVKHIFTVVKQGDVFVFIASFRDVIYFKDGCRQTNEGMDMAARHGSLQEKYE